MKGVTFKGGLHSFTEWGLYLLKQEIGSPKPKEKKIEIDGADGVLDYTDYFGGVKFGNRELKFTFTKPAEATEFGQLVTTIQNTLHGLKMQIRLDDDSANYYVGRVTVAGWNWSKGIGSIDIDVDAEPYKHPVAETVVNVNLTGNAKSVVLKNGRQPVVPTITATASMTYEYKGNSYTASAGTYRIPQIQLVEGNNTVKITGTGQVTFKYMEGNL